MPIREFRCQKDRTYQEVIHPSLDPEKVPPPLCPGCGLEMERLISLPRVDTSSSFKAFDYRGPDGRRWNVGNLHALRQVEKEYTKTGHNIRFDAYSANSSNPNDVDGFGAPYRPPEEEREKKISVDMGQKGG